MGLRPEQVALQALADRLRAATGSDRVTVRGPGDVAGTTTTLLAESLAEGVASMAGAPQAGIVEAPTYGYLRQYRIPLIQDDCRADPLPPAMLTGRFGVGAQMLGPLLLGAELVGTVSVHHLGGPRTWTPREASALEQAVADVVSLLGLVPDSGSSS